MKAFKFFSFFIVITLCFTNTQCEDDDFFPTQIDIINNTVVHIENNETTLNINESIIIETNILNEQITSTGQNILLTDYDYAEAGQSGYYHTLTLYKLTSFGTIAEIPLTSDNITNIEGETLVENQTITARSIFDGTSYKNKFSILLPESGIFYLAGSRFLTDNDGKLRMDGGIYEKALITISSTMVGANANGAYAFTVN
ncbi:hypothetical protein [Lacinutrix sp. Hel_I_90]|uniref:hypothetical protein n=1 Tax=Lacinutrix sp. Hel_I_90 TaxID=1249999 RepID=UPI0005CAFD20|nr:hypothetical protein [Lacinutrix sp. Hel_I_90]